MDVLKIIKDLEDRLFAEHGNVLAKYKETQDDVHMTYYVGKLMEENGHKYVMPERISGEHEDRVYYSEKALHAAFLAGRLIERTEREKMRGNILMGLKREIIEYIEDYR
jgi:hypothetical protein